jgi:hypothetical protein
VAELHESVIRAIVALNFNEPDKALEILLGALHEYNWQHMKEVSNGNAAA